MRTSILFLTAVLAAGAMAGCHTTPSTGATVKSNSPAFMKGYFTKIIKYDGINEQEAVLLAQSQVRFQGDEKRYYIDHPEIVPYDEEHWFVRFPPVNKTLAQVGTNPALLVTIDKKTGAVRSQKEPLL